MTCRRCCSTTWTEPAGICVSAAGDALITSSISTSSPPSWRRHGFASNTVVGPEPPTPHLLVSRVSATDEAGPKASTEVTKTVFERVGISAGRLRQDRIYDEARHTADPVHLLDAFGLATSTAMKYVMAAHPDKQADPIQP